MRFSFTTDCFGLCAVVTGSFDNVSDRFLRCVAQALLRFIQTFGILQEQRRLSRRFVMKRRRRDFRC